MPLTQSYTLRSVAELRYSDRYALVGVSHLRNYPGNSLYLLLYFYNVPQIDFNMKKPPRYTIEETFEDGSVLIKHNRAPEFSGIIKKSEAGKYTVESTYKPMPPNQLDQMAKWYFYTHVVKEK